MTRAGSHALLRAAIAILPVVVALLALAPQAAWALNQTNDARAVDSGGGEAAENRIGVYVTSLRDFATVDDSFGADFWVWGLHPPGTIR